MKRPAAVVFLFTPACLCLRCSPLRPHPLHAPPGEAHRYALVAEGRKVTAAEGQLAPQEDRMQQVRAGVRACGGTRKTRETRVWGWCWCVCLLVEGGGWLCSSLVCMGHRAVLRWATQATAVGQCVRAYQVCGPVSGKLTALITPLLRGPNGDA